MTFLALLVSAAVVWFGARRAAMPDPAFEPDVEAVGPAQGEAQVFVGCVGQTGDPATFMLSISRAKDQEALPPGSPVPRTPAARAGVPFSGGTPERPPTAGTGDEPDGGTPLTRTESYVLVGSGGLPLADRVGHTIEVTGVLDPRADVEFPRLRVVSARDLAENCGPR